MKAIRPYLSIDLETTGLAVDKVQILQIGWVIEDGVSALGDLKKGTIFIDNGAITYGEPYALGMNAWIFQELMKKPNDRRYPTENLINGLDKLARAIFEASKMAEAFDLHAGRKPSKRVQIAGKNAGNFDWPIVLNNLKKAQPRPLEMADQLSDTDIIADTKYSFESLVDHRFIDLGAVFFEEFGRNPGFVDICKLYGMPEINHDALDDAMAVVVALRNKMGVPTTGVKK